MPLTRQEAPELGTVELPLREYPPHPALAWRCSAVLAPLVIPHAAWPEYRWLDDDLDGEAH